MFIVVLFAETSEAQVTTGCCPTSSYEVTYNGQISKSFPNYTIYLRRGPVTTGGVLLGQGQGSTVVFHNRTTGTSWNGSQYFTHPAYNTERVTRYQYANRPIANSAATATARQANVTRSTSPVYVSPPVTPAKPLQPFVAPPWTVAQRKAFVTAPVEAREVPSASPHIQRPTSRAAKPRSTPSYCGSPGSISTATQSLPICNPQN